MAVEASPAPAPEKPATLPAAGAPSPGAPQSAEEGRWRKVFGLPCELGVDLPLPSFRIADLLTLRVGSLIDTGWQVGKDVPLRLNGTPIAWGEFEVVGNQLSVRLTELA